MKKIFFYSTTLSLICMPLIGMENKNESFSQRTINVLYSVGHSLGNIRIPLPEAICRDCYIKHFLPFALLGYACNEYPKQTAVVFAIVVSYALYKSKKVHRILAYYNIIDTEDDNDEYDNVRHEVYPQSSIAIDNDLFVYKKNGGQ